METTERYLGSRQRIVHAVNDKLGIEPDAPRAEEVTANQTSQAALTRRAVIAEHQMTLDSDHD